MCRAWVPVSFILYSVCGVLFHSLSFVPVYLLQQRLEAVTLNVTGFVEPWKKDLIFDVFLCDEKSQVAAEIANSRLIVDEWKYQFKGVRKACFTPDQELVEKGNWQKQYNYRNCRSSELDRSQQIARVDASDLLWKTEQGSLGKSVCILRLENTSFYGNYQKIYHPEQSPCPRDHQNYNDLCLPLKYSILPLTSISFAQSAAAAGRVFSHRSLHLLLQADRFLVPIVDISLSRDGLCIGKSTEYYSEAQPFPPYNGRMEKCSKSSGTTLMGTISGKTLFASNSMPLPTKKTAEYFIDKEYSISSTLLPFWSVECRDLMRVMVKNADDIETAIKFHQIVVAVHITLMVITFIFELAATIIYCYKSELVTAGVVVFTHLFYNACLVLMTSFLAILSYRLNATVSLYTEATNRNCAASSESLHMLETKSFINSRLQPTVIGMVTLFSVGMLRPMIISAIYMGR